MANIYLAPTSFSLYSEKPEKLLQKFDYKIRANNFGRKLNESEILTELKYSDGVIAGTENYTEDILNNLTNLKVISRLGVGMDNIDLATTHCA